jgi:competence protein ComEC
VHSVAILPASALLVGVCLGLVAERPFPHAAPLLLVVWTTALVAWCARRSTITVCGALLGYAFAGAALGGHAAAAALSPPIRTWLDREVGGFALTSLGPPAPHESFTIRARLVEDAAVMEFGVGARVELEAIAVRGAMHRISGGLRIVVSGAAAAARADEWRAGRVIEAPVTFRRPTRYLNAGVPDFERDLALDGIALNATVKSGLLIHVVRRGTRFEETAADLRAHVRAVIRQSVASADALAAAIVTAILIGDRTGLPDEVRARLQAAGTYHVIAISGGNIAILAALIASVFLLTGTAGRASAVAIIVGLLAYAAVVNAGPSVWRATATAIAYLSARVLDHRSPPWNAIAMSALVLGCATPLDVRDVGFALTFGATAGILEAARRVRARPDRGARVGLARIWRLWIVTSVAASAAAEIVLLPIGALAFSRVTFAGLVLNLLAVPLMTIAQVAGLAIVIAGSFEWIARIAGLVAATAANCLVESARLVDVLPWLAVRVPAPSPVVVGLYYLALAAALWRGRWAVLAILCLGIVILTGAAPRVRSSPAEGHVRLTVFDVGQGDALLLQTPARRTVLIDSGGSGFDGGAFDIGGRVLAPALWARGVRRLDVLALTHGDPDHIGGAAAIVRDFAPASLWEGIPVPHHAPLQELLSLARREGVTVERKLAGGRVELDAVSIRVLHPPAPDWERRRVRNDDSLVLELRYGDVALLLTGDVSAAIEHAIVPMLTSAPIRVLKIGHHGSRTSTSAELLDAWKPQIAVISCGRGNRFGHPAPEVMQRLEEAAVRVYRTDRDGQINVDTNGKQIVVTTSTGQKP